MSEALARAPQLTTILRKVRQDGGGVIATIEETGRLVEHRADYLVVTLPASVLRDVAFEPQLPVSQQEAIARLRYGHASRLLLQFERRFWGSAKRPNAFGTDQAFGALWDGNEQQPGRGALLSFLAGGRASLSLQALLNNAGLPGLVDRLTWLGRPSPLLASRLIVWDTDPWSCGGYAYFDPSFRPTWRDVLALPFGRVVFAGEHTSIRFQGYMNGAVESGQRAAAEIEALASKF
jgi:monoamine oxidase